MDLPVSSPVPSADVTLVRDPAEQRALFDATAGSLPVAPRSAGELAAGVWCALYGSSRRIHILDAVALAAVRFAAGPDASRVDGRGM